jgi:hypothetical protein
VRLFSGRAAFARHLYRACRRSLSFGFEDSFVAVVTGEFDLDGAVVEQFGGTVAGDFVHFVEALPSEADRQPAVVDVEAGLESADGDFAATVVGDRDGRWPTEVEMIAIPNVGLDDPLTADELAVRWRAHAGVASNLGNRARL